MTQNVSPSQTKVGWIGTGVMGASMSRRLLDAGYSLTVFNRTAEKAKSLLEAGASWADSPAAVAEASDVIVAIVGMPEDVEQTFMGEAGVLAGVSAGNVVVDMTTSTPDLAKRIFASANKLGVSAIDAPVSGGDVGAKNGTLSIMIGGEADAVSSVTPLFNKMGSTVVHQGPAGMGQHTKMVNQILVAAGMIGVREAVEYAAAAGLDSESVLQSVSSGAAGSWALSNLAPRILNGDYEPGFYVDHFVKDLGIAVAECKRMKLELPGLELANQLYKQLQSQGYGALGTQALVKLKGRQ
jgi:3-hydroxyisobutyrate dehydrogenase